MRPKQHPGTMQLIGDRGSGWDGGVWRGIGRIRERRCGKAGNPGVRGEGCWGPDRWEFPPDGKKKKGFAFVVLIFGFVWCYLFCFVKMKKTRCVLFFVCLFLFRASAVGLQSSFGVVLVLTFSKRPKSRSSPWNTLPVFIAAARSVASSLRTSMIALPNCWPVFRFRTSGVSGPRPTSR